MAFVAYVAAGLATVVVFAVLAIILNVVLWARGEPRPDLDDPIMLAIYGIAALAGLGAFVATCVFFWREHRGDRERKRRDREYNVNRFVEEEERRARMDAELGIQDTERKSELDLFRELDELRWLDRRVSVYGWTMVAGYALIIFGGGALGTWAARTVGNWLATIVGIATLALFMAWPNAFQWQLDALFFGPGSRVAGGQIKARIEAIEVELEARRRMGD